MARPAADFKILKDNRSSYNLIAHEHHVPQSPLFGPPPNQSGGATHRDNYGGNTQREAMPGTGRDYQENRRGLTEEYDRAPVSHRAEVNYLPSTARQVDIIKHEQHIPASPLYRPGGQGIDPRYGSAQGGRRDYVAGRDYEVPRPKEPPTPDYNTTQMNIPERPVEDTKLNLERMRGSQEDLRDYRQNNASWAGYQDRPVNKGPPYTDRPAIGTDRSNKVNPWTQMARDRQNDLMDPRVGGHHDGIGLIGNRNGGALLFIRFPVGQGENVQVAAHAFLKSKTHDNGGRFLGLAKKVYDFGYEKRPTEAIGVYHFPSMDKAFLFFQMDPIIRQPDFPPPYGHAEMWIVSNAYLPDNMNLFNTFLLSEVELHSGKDKREFFETFQKPFESYLYKNGAMPFVICSYGSYDRKSLRRHSYPPNSVVTCHLFQGLDHLNWITNDETYSKFRSLHNQLATEKCTIFNLVKEPFQ
ncbi:uncharacterized protein LOC106050898 isoform X2 [Biomphalaria glabrata]|uniref:Uncharacterized protein LOC106050898 isoform X2 n=1 Tax=Biomphalaria glabrata TaxID=6526 RepID=A0A9W3AX66_BIOGL|nr:uncharacterized protein LOC106050898 isoform X2 [Biomphalaria glabrata]